MVLKFLELLQDQCSILLCSEMNVLVMSSAVFCYAVKCDFVFPENLIALDKKKLAAGAVPPEHPAYLIDESAATEFTNHKQSSTPTLNDVPAEGKDTGLKFSFEGKEARLEELSGSSELDGTVPQQEF